MCSKFSEMQLLSSTLAMAPNTFFCGRGDVMKSTYQFRDQLQVMSGWFDQWNECEQTVALYSLLKRLGPAHARFLALVLDQDLQQCVELSIHEQQANDPVYIGCLSNENIEVAVAQLLSHLPLLRPGNDEAKAQYLGIIPKVLAHSVQHSVHIEESRQLLSYSLIHPAITNEDRRSLTLWLRQLEDRIHSYAMYPQPMVPYGNGMIPPQQQQPPPSSVNSSMSSPIESFGSGGLGGHQMDPWRPGPLLGLNGNSSMDINGYSVGNGLGGNSNSLPPGIGSHHMSLHSVNSTPASGLSPHPDGTHTLPLSHSRVRRSSSLTPPSNTPTRSSRPPSSTDWSKDYVNFSQRLDHAPLSPQSSAASSGSGSESQRDEKDVFSREGSGMKDVPGWLKSLRLHKYSYIFKNMEYEDMMALSEVKLEKMNITKGARHKIVLSIQKLRDRQANLQTLEKDLLDGAGTVKCVLNELKSMLQTPIKASSCSSSKDANFQESSTSGGSDSSGSDPPSPPQTPNGGESDPGSGARVADGDIPGQITRVMGKLCSTLLIMSNQEEENHNYFIMLIDKCLSHEAFTPLQKRRLFSWKQQVQKICHPLPARRSLDGRQNKGKWTNFNHVSAQAPNLDFNLPPGGGSSSLRRRMPVQFHPSAQRLPVPRPNSDFQSAQVVQRSCVSSVIKRPSLQDHMKPHVNVQRTNSAPVRPNPIPASVFGKTVEGATDSNDPELNTRLESLCLSVTEHALGSFDGAVPLF